MTKDEESRLSSIFLELDEDNDGILSYNELLLGFMKTGRTAER